MPPLLRQAGPIEPAFATVRHRAKVTKVPRLHGRRDRHGSQADRGPRNAGAPTAHPDLGALARAGARFECGKPAERDPVLQAIQAAGGTPVQPPAASNQPASNAA